MAPEPSVNLGEVRRLAAEKSLQALRTAIDAMTPDQRSRFSEAQERLASGTEPPLTNREAQRLVKERLGKIRSGQNTLLSEAAFGALVDEIMQEVANRRDVP